MAEAQFIGSVQFDRLGRGTDRLTQSAVRVIGAVNPENDWN